MTNSSQLIQPDTKPRTDSRDNNFALVRLMAAVFIFVGHQAAIMGTTPPMLGEIPIQELGVGILFLISGYLITKSWLSDPNPLRFAIRRFFRLYPPFAVDVLLMTFVAGPLLSELGVKAYFKSTYLEFLKNLRFFIIYILPGVFTQVDIPYTTNGSFWTMPVEAGLYVITPLLVTFIISRQSPKSAFYIMSAIVAGALVIEYCIRAFFPDTRKVFYNVELLSSWHVIVFYLIGILFTIDRAKKLLNLQVACVAINVMLLSIFFSIPMKYLIMYLVFPYLILSLVFDAKPVFRSLGNRIDLTYGIYLYGFFYQQLSVYIREITDWPLTYFQALFMSAIPTILTALLSYYLVEQPCMRLSRKLIGWLKARDSRN